MSVPVHSFHSDKAERAFRRHSALLRAERDDPSLALEPWFVAQREHARDDFLQAFERLS